MSPTGRMLIYTTRTPRFASCPHTKLDTGNEGQSNAYLDYGTRLSGPRTLNDRAISAVVSLRGPADEPFVAGPEILEQTVCGCPNIGVKERALETTHSYYKPASAVRQHHRSVALTIIRRSCVSYRILRG